MVNLLAVLSACVSCAAVLLQMMSVSDVSKPSYADSSGKDRLLVLKLHDGRTSCKALEHKPCSQLSDSMAPGSKVRHLGTRAVNWEQIAVGLFDRVEFCQQIAS